MIDVTRDSSPRIGVISDDLTGASGAAARLASRGLRSRVVWDPNAEWKTYDAVVADTRSRDRSESSYAGSRDWADAFTQAGVSHLEMRVDSTLRGCPSDELEALLEGAQIDNPILIAVPAYPLAGRTTVGGLQRIRNLDHVDSIEVAPELFGARRSRVVHHAAVTEGQESILHQISAGMADGTNAFVLDCVEESHLRSAASAIDRLNQSEHRVVTISSGAWLKYYPTFDIHSYVLVILASPTQANIRQLKSLVSTRSDVKTVTPNEATSLPGEVLADRPSVVVIETLSEERAGDPSAAAAEAAYQVLSAGESSGRRCKGLVVSGGRAASAVADRLGASAFDVSNEPEPLCALGQLVGGPFEALHMVTKGGQIGTEQTLRSLVEAVANHRRAAPNMGSKLIENRS